MSLAAPPPKTSPTDPVARMRAVIDAHTGEGGYVSRVAASEIVAKLRETDPELLAAWLDEQAEHFVWQAINDRDRSRRGRATHVGRSAAFREARTAHEDGDGAPLRRFLDAPYAVKDGSRRRLADLTKDDLLFVADSYETRERENSMRKVFMRALAKKVDGHSTVSDRFSEEQIAAMWSSLGN